MRYLNRLFRENVLKQKLARYHAIFKLEPNRDGFYTVSTHAYSFKEAMTKLKHATEEGEWEFLEDPVSVLSEVNNGIIVFRGKEV